MTMANLTLAGKNWLFRPITATKHGHRLLLGLREKHCASLVRSQMIMNFTASELEEQLLWQILELRIGYSKDMGDRSLKMPKMAGYKKDS